MKRSLYLIIMLAAVTLSGMAQTVGDAFYVYRNDGHPDGFLRDEVISIDYSYEDADGYTYDEIVTQVITTPDSVYKIPLAAIDSICFVQPKTIYQDDVIPLTGDLYQYVVGNEGQQLKLKLNTPLSLLPKVGDKIALLEMTDLLPTGFMGKVSSVSNRSDAIVLDCEGIGLLESVKQYYSVGFVTLKSEGNQTSSPLAVPRKGNIGREIFLPPMGGYLSGGTEVEVDHDDMLMSLGYEVYFSIIPSLQVKGVAMIDDEIGGYVNMVSFTDFNYGWSCKLSGGFESEKKQSFLGEGVDIPIIPGINFYFDTGVYAKLEGTICWQAEGNGSYRLVVQAIGDLLHPENNTLTPRLKKNYSDEVNSVLAGNLATYLGLYGEVGISIGSAKLVKGGIEAAFGLKAEASVTALKHDWENATTSTQLYEQLTTTGNGEVTLGLFGHFGITGEFASGLATGGIGLDFDIGPKLFTGGLAPVFEDVKTSWLLPTEAMASAKIHRNVLFPVQIGFTAFDDEGNRVETVYDAEKYLSSIERSYYILNFQNLDFLKNYKVYPIFKLFDQEVLASPIDILNSGQSVTTLDATDIEDTSATLYGQLAFYRTDMPGYVFFYYGTNDDPLNNGTFIRAGDAKNLSNSSFNVLLTGLESGVTYYYVAGYNNGKKSYLGEVMSFETIDPNKVFTYSATNVKKTEATLNGYFESTDTYPEYGFIYGTSSDLTYTNGNRVAVTSTSSGSFSANVSGLTEYTPYYYRAYLKANGKLYYGGIFYFKTKAEPINPCPDGNHPHMIDLGLPSGRKWACCDVNASHPFDEGGLFAWGETTEKDNYTYDNYDISWHWYYSGIILPEERDAATVNMGNSWCTPDWQDILELINNCSYKLIDEKGQVIDWMATDYVKVIGPNGNYIVLPKGVYWSREQIECSWSDSYYDYLYDDRNGYWKYAYTMHATSSSYATTYWAELKTYNQYTSSEYGPKYLGHRVRAVKKH